MRVLVVSTYELGQQPQAVASATAALCAAGHDVRCADVALDPLEPGDVDWAQGVAFSVPMHTALRLALQVAEVVRTRRPELPRCFFGLYAGVSRDVSVPLPGDAAVAGEFEAGLVAWARGADHGAVVQLAPGRSRLPARRRLPALSRYTRLLVDGEERVTGAVAATRGCSHRCRHCPVPVVYDGRVRRTDREVVQADIDQLVAAGARHITFSDPDFLNAPAHARAVAGELHRRHPGLTFDCTVKVEHILRHAGLWPELADAGCLFVVSAFESVDDRVLGYLDKGHAVAEASAAVTVLRAQGIEIRPSWLPFTPWTSTAALCDLVDFVLAHDLVANVDPVQYSVRLLLPEGSLLLDHPSMAPHLGPYDPVALGWTWTHPDPAIDALQREVAALVEERVDREPAATFAELDRLLRARAGGRGSGPAPGSASAGPPARPRLSEAWFCCSEPTEAQLAPLRALT